MTDRELLELAAKAAGIIAEWHSDSEGMYLYGNRGPDNSKYWNPIANDGDALRLAVRLQLDISCMESDWESNSETNADAATRRAIVRAAAEIGKAMP